MRFESRLALVVACLVLPGLAVAGITNSVPFSESFESGTPGAQIGGTGGWVGDDAVFTNIASSAVVPPGYPLDTTHNQTLAVGADLTLNVTNDANTWIDFMVNPELRESAPTLDAGVQAAFYFDTNGDLNVYCSDGSGMTWSQVWTTVTLATPVATDDWVRVSIQMDYTSATPANPFFQIQLDGVTITDALAYDAASFFGSKPGQWFVAASGTTVGNGGATQLNSFGTQGSCILDDVVVTEDTPRYDSGAAAVVKVTVCASATGGSLDNIGPNVLALGNSITITATASQYWELVELNYVSDNNGAETFAGPAVTVYNEDNSSLDPNLFFDGNATLCATFAEKTINGVKESDYAALGLVDGGGAPLPNGDSDSDGITNEDEFHFGTDPTDTAEYPMVIEIDGATVTFLGSDAVIDTPFTMQRASDLVAGDWADVDTNVTRAAATAAYGGGTNTWTDPAPPADGAFYRPKAVVAY